jgi:hypothetical protein
MPKATLADDNRSLTGIEVVAEALSPEPEVVMHGMVVLPELFAESHSALPPMEADMPEIALELYWTTLPAASMACAVMDVL